MTIARTRRIIRICERQGISALAGMASTEAGDWVTTPSCRPPQGERTPTG